jgi:hypothetical protein
VKGVDDFQTGIRQAIFGTPQKTLIHTATEELTGSKGLAEAVDVVSGLAAGGQIGARIKAADKAAKAAELADEVAAINRSENLLDKAFNGSGLVDESSGFSNFSRRADQIANEAKAAAKVRATVEGNIAESKLAREAKAQAESNARRIPDPWLETENVPVRSNPAGSLDPHSKPTNVPDGSIVASPKRMLAPNLNDNAPVTPSLLPDPSRLPMGQRTKISPNETSLEAIYELQAENHAGPLLSSKGYSAKQNPSRTELNALQYKGDKQPDYIIENRVFDVYTPRKNGFGDLRKGIKQKIKNGQTNRIVLNLDRNSLDLGMIKDKFTNRPINGLEQVIVIKDGEVIPLWP